jgi:hypothetical protein
MLPEQRQRVTKLILGARSLVKEQQRFAAPDGREMNARALGLHETVFNALICIRHGPTGIKFASNSLQPVREPASATNEVGGCDGRTVIRTRS